MDFLFIQCSNLLAPKRPSTAPFVSTDHIEQQIQAVVTDQWMNLHKHFRSNSSDNKTVSAENFKGALERHGISVSAHDLDALCNKYDAHGTGKVDFGVFLKKFSVLGRVSAMGGRNSRNGDRDSHMVSKVLHTPISSKSGRTLNSFHSIIANRVLWTTCTLNARLHFECVTSRFSGKCYQQKSTFQSRTFKVHVVFKSLTAHGKDLFILMLNNDIPPVLTVGPDQ